MIFGLYNSVELFCRIEYPRLPVFNECLTPWVSNLRPAATLVNCIHILQITKWFKRLPIPLTAIFSRAAREPAHNNGT